MEILSSKLKGRRHLNRRPASGLTLVSSTSLALPTPAVPLSSPSHAPAPTAQGGEGARRPPQGSAISDAWNVSASRFPSHSIRHLPPAMTTINPPVWSDRAPPPTIPLRSGSFQHATEANSLSTVPRTATERAMNIPEILDSILRCCTKRSLATCCRVSRLWYRSSIPLLWYSVQFDRESDVSLSEASLKPDPELNAQRLASLCKYGLHIYHLKPWPGLVESDLDMVAFNCGSHLETLDLSCTNWRDRDDNIYLTRHKPCTWDLISLITRLPKLRTLVLNLCIGLDMNEVLRSLIALRQYNKREPARPISMVEGNMGRTAETLVSLGNTVSATTPTSQARPTAATSPYHYRPTEYYGRENLWSLDRVEMDWSKGLREMDLITFLEMCCSTFVGYQDVPGKGKKRVVRRGIRHLVMRYVSLERCTFLALNSPRNIEDVSNKMAQAISRQSNIGSSDAGASGSQGDTGTRASSSPPTSLYNHEESTQGPPQQYFSHSSSSAISRSINPGGDIIRPLSLTTLNLEYTRLTDIALCNIVKRCQFLLVLNVSKNPYLTKQSMNYIARYCPRLFSINLSYGVKIENRGFITIFQKCTALRKVYVSHTLIQDSAIYALLGATLSASSSSLSPDELANNPGDSNHSHEEHSYSFKKNHRLLSLDISACFMITYRAVCRIVQNSLDLDTLIISQNKQIEVADIFPKRSIFDRPLTFSFVTSPSSSSQSSSSQSSWNSPSTNNISDDKSHSQEWNICEDQDPIKDQPWVCQSLAVLNMVDVTYTPSRDRSLYIRDVYFNMYRQIQELCNLRSLHLGNPDFIVDLPMSILMPLPSPPRKNPARRYSSHLMMSSNGATSGTSLSNGIAMDPKCDDYLATFGTIPTPSSLTPAIGPNGVSQATSNTSAKSKIWRAGKVLTMPTSRRGAPFSSPSLSARTGTSVSSSARSRGALRRPMSMIMASATRSIFRQPHLLTRRSSCMDLGGGQEGGAGEGGHQGPDMEMPGQPGEGGGAAQDESLLPIPMLPWPKENLNLLHMLSKLHRLEALTISSMERPGVKASLFGLKELGLLASKLSKSGKTFHVEVGIRGATGSPSSSSSLMGDATNGRGGNHESLHSSQSVTYVELKEGNSQALEEQEARLMGKDAVITNVVVWCKDNKPRLSSLVGSFLART